ncbi:MAG: TonB-dependent receptor [Bacteroidetes bacterium]|nr:TonB-dependent receptor [Bacteroidota bacterium]MBS1539058.1 TonB-dependent receptor [Bacteroidota bacterium]
MAFLLANLAAWAQVRTVTGKVLSGVDNTSLPGVNVIIKGTANGTVTDADGAYSISVPADAVLVFSFVGYASQEIPVGASSVIDVSLKSDATKLDEVVVVGYGEQSRKNITSAMAKLDNQVLVSTPRANIGGALQGTLPGLQVVNASGTPGAAPYIVLRGGASINSPGSPLVIVDGVIRTFNEIAPEDIASINILKDAASTAIYGARANNGVILITTKRGKEGTAQISYKYVAGVNVRRPGYKYVNARDYITLNRQGNLNSGRTLAQVNATRGYGLLTDPANLASFDIQAYTPGGPQDQLLTQGWQTVNDPMNPGSQIIFKDHSGEIENLVFQTNPTQEHYLSATGGNDKAKYFASFDYYSEDGIIIGSKYNRYTGALNGSYKVRNNVEIGTAVNLSTAQQLGVQSQSEINTLYRTLALWPTFNPWLDAAKTQPNPGNSNTDGNPLYWLSKNPRSNETNQVTVNGYTKWDILPGLSAKATGNAYLIENIYQSFQKATQLYTNIFATPPTYNNTSRTATASFSRIFQKQFNVTLNYSKTFLDKHEISAMWGAEYFTNKMLSMQVQGTGAPTDDISTVNASTTFGPGSNYSNIIEYRILSNFARINYDYDQKYLLQLVYRQDAISALAPQSRTGFFPGMSAGWLAHREEFFQNSFLSKYVSTLKPRVSYGVNGNIAGLTGPGTNPYQTQGVFSSQGNYNGNLGYLNNQYPVNTGLQWEKSKTTDVGVDIGVLQNKITLLFDYYDRRTSNLLTNLQLPSYMGYSSILTNNGTFQNKGYEIALNANILDLSNGLKWDVGVNAAHVKNTVLQLPYNGNPLNRQSTGNYPAYQVSDGHGGLVWVGGVQEGKTLGDIYAFKQVGIYKDAADVDANRVDLVAQIGGPATAIATSGGIARTITPGDVKWLDVDKNDTIDSRDMVKVGNIFPKWTGGFSSNLSYKGFSLYTRFDFALGHTIYNDLVARTLGNYQGTFNYIDLQKQAWTPTNTNTDIPKVYYADQAGGGKKNYTRINNANPNLNGNNSRFYEKGDYMACREITLSYNFPKTMLAKTKFFSQARAYISANNLFYVTKFSGPSPEPPVLNGLISGVYRGTYPTPKTFVLGFQVTF